MGRFIGTVIVIWLIIGSIYWLWTRHTVFTKILAIWVAISGIVCLAKAIKDK